MAPKPPTLGAPRHSRDAPRSRPDASPARDLDVAGVEGGGGGGRGAVVGQHVGAAVRILAVRTRREPGPFPGAPTATTSGSTPPTRPPPASSPASPCGGST